MGINMRGSFLCAQACMLALVKSDNPHILTLARLIDLQPKWFKQCLSGYRRRQLHIEGAARSMQR